jgi:hypothetical protein
LTQIRPTRQSVFRVAQRGSWLLHFSIALV